MIDVPSGHGCKCVGDNCNADICSAAENHDPPHDTSDGQDDCKTINCQRCVFPFVYNGVEYNQCTSVDSENGAPWCAVNVSIGCPK